MAGEVWRAILALKGIMEPTATNSTAALWDADMVTAKARTTVFAMLPTHIRTYQHRVSLRYAHQHVSTAAFAAPLDLPRRVCAHQAGLAPRAVSNHALPTVWGMGSVLMAHAFAIKDIPVRSATSQSARTTATAADFAQLRVNVPASEDMEVLNASRTHQSTATS